MYCSKCGKELLDNSQFCSYCGANLSNTEKQFNEELEKYSKQQSKRDISLVKEARYIIILIIVSALLILLPTFIYYIRHLV